MESRKVNAYKVLMYSTPLALFLLLIGGLALSYGRIEATEIETLSPLMYGFASTLLSIIHFILRKGEVTQRRLAIEMLEANMITVLACAAAPIILGIIVPSAIGAFDPISLIWKCVMVAFAGYVISIVLMISILELIGKSRINKIESILGASRTEKIKIAWSKLANIWNEYTKSRVGMVALVTLIIIFAIAIIGPFIAPENPLVPKQFENYTPQPPSDKHWFGTDYEDKDVWSQFLLGGMTALIVSFVAGAISMIIGTLIGILAGYYGKGTDEILMRTTDFFLVIPWFPLMIVLVALLGRSFAVVIFVIGVVSWPDTARIIRAQVLSVKEKMYIERSRALGATDRYIMKTHIFPNVFPLIVVNGIMIIASAIFSESFLDFFGLGDPNTISWGWMLERAQERSAMTNMYWWWVAPPALGIVLLIICFYLIGDTLDSILNPRLKRR